MIEKIEPWIKGKRVLLLGFGREGQSTFHLLKKLGGYEKLDIATFHPRESCRMRKHCGYPVRIIRNVWITMT